LPDTGRSSRDPAALAAVPLWSSFLSALARVLANPSGTTCSQVSVVTATSFAGAVSPLSEAAGEGFE